MRSRTLLRTTMRTTEPLRFRQPRVPEVAPASVHASRHRQLGVQAQRQIGGVETRPLGRAGSRRWLAVARKGGPVRGDLFSEGALLGAQEELGPAEDEGQLAAVESWGSGSGQPKTRGSSPRLRVGVGVKVSRRRGAARRGLGLGLGLRSAEDEGQLATV